MLSISWGTQSRIALFVFVALYALPALPVPVQLQNGTATFSQDFDGVAYFPDMAIDDILDGNSLLFEWVDDRTRPWRVHRT